LPFRIRACCLGADHQRERLLLLAELTDTMRPRLQGDEFGELARTPQVGRLLDTTRQDWGNPAPRVCRGSDGIPNRVDRIRALGNAVVPQVAEYVGKCILEAT
jgi:DNA (cytosine-5)-methyltransferase 1